MEHRELSYVEAIREGMDQSLELSNDVFLMGQLVDYKGGVFGSTTGLVEKYGEERIRDFPVAEAGMTSMALGAALKGMRPILAHQRVDFMVYSLDALVNWISLWYFKSGGQSPMPITIRAVIGKGWGQGPQHSKSLHAWFAHLPGLKVAMPSTAFDAKGLLMESVFGEDPCVILESRSLFQMKAEVPLEPYRVRYGQAVTRRQGKDVTLVALGYLVPAALQAAEELAKHGIDVEVIDPRTITPFDRDTVCASVARTKRLVVADPGWELAGFSAEVIASVCERVGNHLAAKPVRINYPDSHTPMTRPLEKAFYPDEETIFRRIRELFPS